MPERYLTADTRGFPGPLRAILAVRQLHRESQEVAGGSLKKVIAAFPRAIVVAILNKDWR